MRAFRAFIDSLKKRQKGFVRLAILLAVNAVVFAGITSRLANKQDRLATDQERLSAELAQKTEELERLNELILSSAGEGIYGLDGACQRL